MTCQGYRISKLQNVLDIGQANSDKHCVVVYLLAQGHAVDMIDLMGNLVFNGTRFLLRDIPH
jgi:hypothetical protein